MGRVNELLPWHTRQWQRFSAMWGVSRVPHALLLSGQSETGKNVFALRLAQALLCEDKQRTDQPCGNCRGCRLFAAGNHPDLISVSADGTAKEIVVDAIRDLISRANLSRHYAHYKVAIVSPADAMNRAAANSFLKTLEEPTGSTVFVLVSDHKASLPPTIKSRCQSIDFPAPTFEEVRDWLVERTPPDKDPEVLFRLSNGAPLAALALLEDGQLAQRNTLWSDFSGLVQGQLDPVAVADRWRDVGPKPVLNWLTSFLFDLIRLKSTLDPSVLTNVDFGHAIHGIATKLDLKQLYAVVDICLEARGTLQARLNLNEQLFLEGIAMGCAAKCSDRIGRPT